MNTFPHLIGATVRIEDPKGGFIVGQIVEITRLFYSVSTADGIIPITNGQFSMVEPIKAPPFKVAGWDVQSALGLSTVIEPSRVILQLDSNGLLECKQFWRKREASFNRASPTAVVDEENLTNVRQHVFVNRELALTFELDSET